MSAFAKQVCLMTLGEYLILRYLCQVGNGSRIDIREDLGDDYDAVHLHNLIAADYVAKSKVQKGKYHPTPNGRDALMMCRCVLGINRL